MKVAPIRLILCALAALSIGCAPAVSTVYAVAPPPAAETPVVTVPPPPPPPEHCADYENMEAGRGHPVNQDWFNHLDAKGYARVRMACVYLWGGAEFDCLERLWTNESGWNHRIWNKGGSGAYGIPQADPARKMASAGGDFMTNPRVQVRWGLQYIKDRYLRPTGTRCRGPY